MNKNILIWCGALVLIVIAVYVTRTYNSDARTDNAPSIQKPSSQTSTSQSKLDTKSTKATEFKLSNLAGEQVSLSDFKGKNIFVNFFATWCPPCVGEMPDIQKNYEKYKDKDLVVLAVDLKEKITVVKSFIEKNKYTFPVLLDLDGTVGNKYNTSSIPVSVFIDKEGNIVTRKVGAMSGAEIENYIKMLLDKQ